MLTRLLGICSSDVLKPAKNHSTKITFKLVNLELFSQLLKPAQCVDLDDSSCVDLDGGFYSWELDPGGEMLR